MAVKAEPIGAGGGWVSLRKRLVKGLESCVTEADIVQTLYAELHPALGYDVILLQVLEREGWYHSLPIDHGVLQDLGRGLLADSHFGRHFDQPQTSVSYATPKTVHMQARGPGVQKDSQTLIWVPIRQRGQPIGAVSYQLYVRRGVPPEELVLLERVHAHLGAVVSNAYLNEMTRNQALSLTALNSIGRALSSTHDEDGVVTALQSTLMQLIPVDRFELVVPNDKQADRARVLRVGRSSPPLRSEVNLESLDRAARAALIGGQAGLRVERIGERDFPSAVWVPLVEGDRVRAALAVQSQLPNAYEQSTVTFLQQVGDQVSLALRNAWSYEAVEDQRRRLEVVNAVGRRLASSLDRWSITRALREELSRHLEFDIFSLATVKETPTGPVAEGYVYDSGEEKPLVAVPLSEAGPSREAYESGKSILLQRSPWARQLESKRRGRPRVTTEGAVMTVTRPGSRRRVASRSIIWVPVRRGSETAALLSLQSYRADAFSDWHVQLLEDVGAHVSLALATAEHFQAAQAERRRLEALHVLEMGVAGAGDEQQIADAVFNVSGSFIEPCQMVLVYLDAQGRLAGHRSEQGTGTEPLPPKPVESTRYFRRLLEERATIVEASPPELARDEPATIWSSGDERTPKQVLWVPLLQRDRVIGALSAQRYEDVPFSPDEVRLLESAAPVVGIALRTVRLNRANELALAHSVRIQEVAALAGNDLRSVVASVADQAQTMLDARGTACWAFDDELRVSAEAATGDRAAIKILNWADPDLRRTTPRTPISGTRGRVAWALIPLWYADRLVGALGSAHPAEALEEPAAAHLDFLRHAAIAIENARLAAETRGRIHTLEAVAAFADLDITDPKRTRVEMCRLVEHALEASQGAVWLLDGEDMVRGSGDDRARSVIPGKVWPGILLRASGQAHSIRGKWPELSGLPASGEVFARPIPVEGRILGILTADATSASPAETRRLMGVLAGQAALALARMRLVAELDRQARQLNAIVSHAPVGVVLEDADGKVVYANPVIERLYGVPAESLAGAPADQLRERAGATVVVDPEAEPGAPTELRLRERDTVVQVRRVVIPGSQEHPASVLTLHEDITQQRAVREAKDLMLRAIGHEVRSPAAAMRSTIASLVQWDEVIEPGQRHALIEEAYEQSDRLLSLVESQLTIAKLETGRFEPDPAAVQLQRVFEQVHDVLSSRYGRRVEVVEAAFPADLADGRCEPAHLEQVLTNLVGNALEYTRATRVRVSARTRGRWLEVTVGDNGDGLPPDRVATLFEKTHPAGRNRSRGGLGLGLYLCRLVVERSFGGRIWLQRTGPTGTVFRFTIPAGERQPSRRRPVSVVR